MPKYPAQIDNSQSLPTAVDNLTPVQGSIFNKLRDAVLAVESELGVKPSGSYTTVRARIDNLENIIGNLQIIELHKDLGGTLEEPLVISIQGKPISTVAPTYGQALIWNGIAWTPTTGTINNADIIDASYFINWDTTSTIIHTVLDSGHTPGVYLITSSIIVTTEADTGTLSRTIDWVAPTYGADSNSLGSIVATVTGTQLQNSLTVVSDGTAAITVTYEATSITGTPVIDLYSTAMLQGPIS
jgi:hypothetical protein